MNRFVYRARGYKLFPILLCLCTVYSMYGRWWNFLIFVSLPYFLSLPGGCQDKEKEIELGRIDRIAWSSISTEIVKSDQLHINFSKSLCGISHDVGTINFCLKYNTCMHKTIIGSCYFRITFEIRALLVYSPSGTTLNTPVRYSPDKTTPDTNLA